MSPNSTEKDAAEAQSGASSLARANGDAPDISAEQDETTALSETPGADLGGGSDDEAALAVSPGEDDESADEQSPPPSEDEGEDRFSIDPGIAELDPTEVEGVTFDGSFAPDPFMNDELETDEDRDLTIIPPEMTQMLFVEVALMLPATHPVVVLQEADAPFRELRIPVGGAEGIAISYAARGIETPRPLTHELFTRVLEEFTMTLDMVQITDVSGTSFSAEIVISGPMGARAIDCRPSDAIALALRQRLPVPIMAAPIVLAIAGTDPLGAN